jgi:hypothetical protein
MGAAGSRELAIPALGMAAVGVGTLLYLRSVSKVGDRSTSSKPAARMTIKLDVGMEITVTSDEDLFKNKCKVAGLSWPFRTNGEPRLTETGKTGNIKSIDMTDDTVELTKDIGWVPIRALVGYENWEQVHDGEVTCILSKSMKRHGFLIDPTKKLIDRLGPRSRKVKEGVSVLNVFTAESKQLSSFELWLVKPGHSVAWGQLKLDPSRSTDYEMILRCMQGSGGVTIGKDEMQQHWISRCLPDPQSCTSPHRWRHYLPERLFYPASRLSRGLWPLLANRACTSPDASRLQFWQSECSKELDQSS